MTEPAQPVPPLPVESDAEKLLSVCRVVWPKRDHEQIDGASHIVLQRWAECGKPMSDAYYPTCLDDLRRVLLAFTPSQLVYFDQQFDADAGAAWILTAPTTQILDALHRAVCPE